MSIPAGGKDFSGASCEKASQVALAVKCLADDAGGIRDSALIAAREDPLEEGTKTHSSILAWRIPRMEEPDGL